MQSAIVLLAAAGVVSSSTANDTISPDSESVGYGHLIRSQNSFCLPGSKTPTDDVLKQCRTLVELLQTYEARVLASEVRSQSLEAECRNLARRIYGDIRSLDKFDAALKAAGGQIDDEKSRAAAKSKPDGGEAKKPAPAQETPSFACDKATKEELARRGASSDQQSAFERLVGSFKAARTASRDMRGKLQRRVAALKKWTPEQRGIRLATTTFLAEPGRPLALAVTRKPPGSIAVTPESCNPSVSLIDSVGKTPTNRAYVAASNDCRKLAERMVTSAISAGPPKPVRPLRGSTLEPSIQTGSSASNIQLTASTTFSRIERGFAYGNHKGKDNVPIRRPRTWTASVGIDARGDGDSASVIGGNSDSGRNFFSLERLNSDLLVKGSLGYNFFRRQSLEQFEIERKKFVNSARRTCETSLRQAATAVPTSCADGNLIAWLYERKDGKYIRAKLVEEYDQLIWLASSKYPLFGFGVSSSFGWRSHTFQSFLDDEDKFDPSRVTVSQFFSDSAETRRQYAESINADAISTIGGYVYGYDKLERFKFLEGGTLVGRLTYKTDFPDDLDDDRIEVCRTDLPLVGGAVVEAISLSDQCREVLPFRPRQRKSLTGVLEGRLAFKTPPYLPKMGIKPELSYERVFALDDDPMGENQNTFRIDTPLFFSQKEDKLTGGVGVAYEIDLSKGDQNDNEELIFYIFFGKKFSLDGSKQ